MEDFTNRHDKKIKCFKIHMDKIKVTLSWYTGDKIKKDWIDSARKHYARDVDFKEVVGLLDTTLLGKCKSGMIITDNYLYWKRSDSAGRIQLSFIDKITVFDESQKKDSEKGLIFYFKDGQKAVWDSYCNVNCSAFIEFMNDYLKI